MKSFGIPDWESGLSSVFLVDCNHFGARSFQCQSCCGASGN